MITPETVEMWARRITQEEATRLITNEWFNQPDRPSLALHQIERDDGSIDYAAWSRNRINLFTRWLTCRTDEHRKKFNLLLPAITRAIRSNDFDLYSSITASGSVEYLLSRVLKKRTSQARYCLALPSPMLSGSVTKPFMRYRRYATATVSSVRDMASETHYQHKELNRRKNRELVCFDAHDKSAAYAPTYEFKKVGDIRLGADNVSERLKGTGNDGYVWNVSL
ncbi:hypothetical protein AH448_17175 [Salmonella enterica subsp. diarizonae]|uniref:toxin YdaT family protein n=1 Tax=Salmonella enterica TaxID=28901 RepID=UPI0009B0C4BC|nr:toxin YdaT family protein [Salmonella enterica]EAA6844572.1 hypothetical protein [Salmonella enterica subsp. enterica serovar Pensacola]EAW1825202.1 hypothetical protein [Salmonella enterica subsp. diarizonae]EDQ6556652.1 hypothetical protein [Salmonella enterica subsp. enterica]EDT6983895.1 hypothetical protein [Salmonella enterica subsp. arizonae]EAR0004058.1 hypothetical protein [Salmonella enterica]